MLQEVLQEVLHGGFAACVKGCRILFIIDGDHVYSTTDEKSRFHNEKIYEILCN